MKFDGGRAAREAAKKEKDEASTSKIGDDGGRYSWNPKIMKENFRGYHIPELQTKTKGEGICRSHSKNPSVGVQRSERP